MYRPQNTAWVPTTGFSDALRKGFVGGHDYAHGFQATPSVRYARSLAKSMSTGSHHGGDIAEESHILHAPDLDWNRHMDTDKVRVSEALRQSHGEDIVHGAQYLLRMKEHHIPERLGLGPLGPEQFNNTFNY